MAEYRLSENAVQDLSGILRYTWHEHGPDQAEIYVSNMKKRLAMLADNPALGRERDEFSPPVRLFPSGRHVIVYLTLEDHILIVRILHKRQDMDRTLTP